MKKTYFITYTTQSNITDVCFISDLIETTLSPYKWIEKLNKEGSVKYSLIFFEEIGTLAQFIKKIKNIVKKTYYVTYVTQSGIEDCAYNTIAIRKDPVIWILEKNNGEGVKYSLINWWD